MLYKTKRLIFIRTLSIKYIIKCGLQNGYYDFFYKTLWNKILKFAIQK